jgi:hypothetical protein
MLTWQMAPNLKSAQMHLQLFAKMMALMTFSAVPSKITSLLFFRDCGGGGGLHGRTLN